MELGELLYNKSEYIETASGNKVSRQSVLCGSQNIVLNGKKRTGINQREWWGLVNWRIQELARLKWIVVATWECRRILPERLNIPNWKSGFF
ncbi:hypothetical protein G4228_007108 [Cervus hanglu yarkandensis]|nr:hypothetical protein G4228_007108 [Cervus hanglu yarkandensis]